LSEKFKLDLSLIFPDSEYQQALANGFVAFLIVLSLGGCAGHSHRLASSDGLEGIVGSFSHEGNQKPTMVLELDGVRFEGSGFEIKRGQNLTELRRMFGPGKHYDQLTSGMDTDHLIYSVTPELRSSNGETIHCVLAWKSGQGPSGACVAFGGKRISVQSENE